jgi:hypothetical protein
MSDEQKKKVWEEKNAPYKEYEAAQLRRYGATRLNEPSSDAWLKMIVDKLTEQYPKAFQKAS